MSQAEWADRAEADLYDIYLWIARHENRRSTARRIVREIRRECDEYAGAFADDSILGTAHPAFGEDVRLFTHQRWVIVFRPIANGIEVLRVLDGSRDISRLLGE